MAEWFEDFFHGVALDLWRQAVTPEETRREVDFLVAELGRAPRARLLDVPCGNGRHALELARRGYSVTGLDISEEFLAEARAASDAEGLDVRWILGDMRRMEPGTEFDGAFCFGNSFGYLEHADTVEFLSRLGGALKPGARFVLQTGIAAESLLPHLKEREWYQVGDILMALRNTYRAADSCLETEFTFVRDGSVDVRTALSRVYTAAELARLLEQAGLRVLRLLGSIQAKPYALGDPLLLLVAEHGGPGENRRPAR